MVLAYKSTTSEMVQIVVRDSDGSKRVVTLERDPSTRNWNGSVDLPSGQRWAVGCSVTDYVDAIGMAGKALVDKESDYRRSKGRGHRPEPKTFDHNRSLPEGYDIDSVIPKITGYER